MGLLAALDAGVVCPLSAEVDDRAARRGPEVRRNWYSAARREREERHDSAKAERRQMGRVALTIPELAPSLAAAPPF